MARKNVLENFRVEIQPSEGTFWFSLKTQTPEQLAIRRCEAVAAEVKRHVDGIESVSTVWDTNPVCEHCGSRWTEDSPDFNGGCCDKDMDAEPAAQTVQS